MTYHIRDRAYARIVSMALALMLAAIFWTPPASAQTLTLRQALTLARDADLGLPASEARIAAASAALRQAAVKPNAMLGLDVENFVGTSPYSAFDRAEATLYYQQLLERGDKPAARMNAARASLEVVRLHQLIRALDLFKQVESAWAEAVGAQASVRAAEEQLAALQSLQTEINRRVKAARDPVFAGARIDTQVLQAQIALDQSRTQAQSAHAALVAFWSGVSGAPLDLTEFENTTMDVAAPIESADIALLGAMRDVARADIELEQSRSVADITLRGGVRYFQNGEDLALIVGGSIPLGVNETNRNNIERAQAERLAAERDIAAARVTRAREITRLQARLTAHANEARRIRGEVVPKAEETVKLVRDVFNRGGFTYIDVIDAQRALVEAQMRRTEALKNFHLDRAELDRLTGRHADLVSHQETRP